jgi:hypothetical protein
MSDFYAWGRDPIIPGCEDYTFVAATGNWLHNGYSGGYAYSVTLDSQGFYDLSTARAGVDVIIPPGYVCWTNQYVEVVTESLDFGDAMGGTATSKLLAYGMQFQTSPGGTWLNLSPACNVRLKFGGTLESVFKCDVNAGLLETWTAR